MKIITNINIIPKYTIVLKKADVEKINVKSFISASNNLATNNDKNCEPIIPINNPTPKEIRPTNNVSITNIADTLDLLIPKVKYSPNSFFLLLIKKLFEYIIKNPKITETKTDK